MGSRSFHSSCDVSVVRRLALGSRWQAKVGGGNEHDSSMFVSLRAFGREPTQAEGGEQGDLPMPALFSFALVPFADVTQTHTERNTQYHHARMPASLPPLAAVFLQLNRRFDDTTSRASGCSFREWTFARCGRHSFHDGRTACGAKCCTCCMQFVCPVFVFPCYTWWPRTCSATNLNSQNWRSRAFLDCVARS